MGNQASVSMGDLGSNVKKVAAVLESHKVKSASNCRVALSLSSSVHASRKATRSWSS